MSRRTWHSCDPLDLHRLARDWFVGARRIELTKLASELGISRATAYRWAGSAEQLVGEVLASLTEDAFKYLISVSRTRGYERVLEVLGKGMRLAHRFQPLRLFLHHDPQTALRIVASKDGPVQAKTIALIADLIEHEVEQGHMTIPVEPKVLAFAITRVVESFLYADLISDTQPNLDDADQVLRLMLEPKLA